MKPLEWLSNLLTRHDIPKPDGRPLYQYRVTDEEFETLKGVLRDASQAGIDKAIGYSFFDRAFVIYGAEWWRRHYEGDWGWEGIFQSFSSDYQALATNQRNTLVEVGLRRWQRKVRTTNRRRNFLGSIAIEGGLPLRQLANTGGWLQPTLNQVTKRYVELGEDRFEASYIASQYSQYIPQTFRREEVYEILGDMITAVAALKRTYDLGSKDNPIDWLNQHQPEWKFDFPLPLDDETGHAILADMVRTAIKTRQDSQASVFTGTRYLTGVSIGEPKLCFQLQGQPFYRLCDLFGGETTEIPHRLQLELYSSEGKTWRFADAYRVQWQGHSALRINNQQRLIQGEESLAGIRLRFRHLGSELDISELDIGADSLDKDVPWSFVEKGDRWQFAGQASQKLSAAEAVVWVPDNLTQGFSSTELVSVGRFADGEFFKIDEDLLIENDENNYSISVNQEEETPVEYMLSGKRFGFSARPAELFIGKPRLVVLNKVTGHRNMVQNHRVRTRPTGSRGDWNTLADTLPGMHELQVVDDCTIMYRKRVGILPDNASIRLVAGESPRQGEICMAGMGEWQAVCRDVEVKARYAVVDNDLTIGLEAPDLPPGEVNIEVWRDNPHQPIKLTLPYPSSGAVVIDPLGTPISTSADLYTKALHGYRLRFFARTPGRPISIRMKLIDAELPDSKDLYIEFPKKLAENSVELSLIDFASDIQSLLAISKNLDACVELALYSKGAQCIALKFRRFKVNIEPEEATGKVQLPSNATVDLSFDEQTGLELLATPFSQPKQTPIKLDATISGGMTTGVWQFSPEKRSPGPWLIYSSETSEVLVRPILWNIPGYTLPEQIKTIPAAVYSDDRDERAKAFQILFNEMARDNNHSGWDYLRSLSQRFQHLPLSTFQVWQDAIKNSRLLAAMVIQELDEILERLEEELPVMWELIPISIWHEVLSTYQKNLDAALDDDVLVKTIIGEAIDRIAALNDVMATVAKIIRQGLLGETHNELKIMQTPAAGDMTATWLAAPHQALLQRQADSQWPDILRGEVQEAWERLPAALTKLLPGDQFHRTTVVHLPFVLVHGLFVETAETGDPLHVFKYRRLKQFDEDWYSAAFNYACGYWSQQNMAT